MKNAIIIAATAVAAAAVFAFIVKRRKKNIPVPAPGSNPHHLTNIFANAKKHVSNIQTEDSNP